MVTSRPTILDNNIHDNADAAISADPDSFQYSLFEGPRSDAITTNPLYTADYSRTGPLIHGNVLARDSINGLFIRIRTNAGEPIDVLDVTARLTATDIVYVLSQNLEIQGEPGGAVMLNSSGQLADPTTGTTSVSSDVSAGGGVGGLIIDPGVIVKSNGSRIEVGMGAQLIAEGTSAKPIIFTSLCDNTLRRRRRLRHDRQFAGSVGRRRRLGGLLFNPMSTGSFDHVEITYGGGMSVDRGRLRQIQRRRNLPGHGAHRGQRPGEQCRRRRLARPQWPRRQRRGDHLRDRRPAGHRQQHHPQQCRRRHQHQRQ